MAKTKYEREIPWILRILGCRAMEGSSFRFKWGEFCGKWGLSLSYFVYHEEASFHIAIIWGHFYFKVPMLINQRRGTEDWSASFGLSVFERTIHLNWRTKCRILHFPWDYQHVRHTFLWPDGRVHHHRPKRGGYEPAPLETKEKWPYVYVLQNGEVQHRTATINGEEREWRWRWFTLLPWPRKVSRYIDIDFDKEVGEGTGSWKGGTFGCSYDWKKGESMVQSLRRMEAERRFTR